MKSDALPKNFPTSQEEWEQLIAAAPDQIDDPNCAYNPNSQEAVATYWKNGVVVHAGGSQAVHAALAIRRVHNQHVPVKISLTIQYSSEVVEYFRNIGPGWQSRMDDALKEWINAHPIG